MSWNLKYNSQLGLDSNNWIVSSRTNLLLLSPLPSKTNLEYFSPLPLQRISTKSESPLIEIIAVLNAKTAYWSLKCSSTRPTNFIETIRAKISPEIELVKRVVEKKWRRETKRRLLSGNGDVNSGTKDWTLWMMGTINYYN